MILFLGDSFTWGQGLEWEHLILDKKWKVEDVDKLIPPHGNCESLPIDLYDYRTKHHFPRLVSEHFNESYHIGRFGNGGSNRNIYHILNNIEEFIHPENLNLIVIQLTHSSRNRKVDESNIDTIHIEDAEEFVNNIKRFQQKYSWVRIVCLSWLPELGEEIKNKIGNKYVVSFNLNEKEKYGFENYISNSNWGYTLNSTTGVQDGHFNSKGHKLISDSIIKHIESNNIITKNNFYQTKGKKTL
jgi:lysophospholipase L1-like esterase